MPAPSLPAPGSASLGLPGPGKLSGTPLHATPSPVASFPPRAALQSRWSELTHRRTPTQLLAIAGAALVVIGLLIFFVTRPSGALLLVTVSGPKDSAVDKVKVLIDGEEKCSQSPCRTELPAGAHVVRVIAPGYVKPADRPVVIKAGTDEIVNLALTSVSEGTGLKVAASGKGLHLFFDGKDRGELPLTLDGLNPGEHEVSISGNDAYKSWSDKITLTSGEVKELEPKLEIQKGLIRVELGDRAEGAQVTLECGGERRVLSPPTTVEVKPQDSCRVMATKRGVEPVSLSVSFEPGQAEKTVRVVFPEAGGGGGSMALAANPGPTHGSSTPTTAGSPRSTPSAAGSGTISINAIPVSKALVDGRPVGQTPTKVTVSAGNHNVVFINSEKGRKSVGVVVQPGQTAIAAVRF